MVKIAGKVVGLDTNIFIYQFGQHEEFNSQTKFIFESLAENKSRAITSVITFIELLSFHANKKEIDLLKTYFSETPNLDVYDVDQTIGDLAAKIRREYNFRLPDAVQLATCLNNKADMFITKDQKLKSFKEIPIVII